jgi:hypothetical protein
MRRANSTLIRAADSPAIRFDRTRVARWATAGAFGAGDEIALMLSSKRTRPAEAAPRAEEIPRKMKAAAQTYFTAL